MHNWEKAANGYDTAKFNVPLYTVQDISETIFADDHLTHTSKSEPNYNKVQVTTKKA